MIGFAFTCMLEIVQLEPLEEFQQAIQNPLTRKNYQNRLATFLDTIGVDGSSLQEKAQKFVSKCKEDEGEWATFQITQYMNIQKSRVGRNEISESTLPNYFKPVKLFCVENNILLNWKKIARRIPSGKKYASDRAPTLEEIRRILAYPDRRIKAAVLIMVSSGARVGLFDYLKYGDIMPIRNEQGDVIAAKIKVYAGCKEEYQSFISPEAYDAVEEYITFRKGLAEIITPDSPVLRDLFKPDHLGRGSVELPKLFRSDFVRHLVDDALKASGIRSKGLELGKRRYDFQPDHGFRKYFNTVCDRHMKTLYVEFLLGHDTGLKESYNRAQDDELLREYLKAVPELTIFGKPKAREFALSKTEENSDHEIASYSQQMNERVGILEQTQLRLISAEESNAKMLAELLQLIRPRS